MNRSTIGYNEISEVTTDELNKFLRKLQLNLLDMMAFLTYLREACLLKLSSTYRRYSTPLAPTEVPENLEARECRAYPRTRKGQEKTGELQAHLTTSDAIKSI